MRMTRREFVGSAALAAVSAGARSAAGTVAAVSGKVPSDKPRNRRPYAGLDWSKVIRVKTTSHGHAPSPWFIDQYLKRGFGLLTLSNYYPSAPWCPLSKMTENYYRLHHDHPVMVNGKRVEGPFDWNKIIAPWKGTIDFNDIAKKKPEWAAQFPFVEGRKMFKPLPPGVLEAPNAEHHNFLLEDGKPARDTASHGYNFGSGEFWGTAIDRMIEGLIYPDGGGVTVNHPSWTKLDRGLMLKLLRGTSSPVTAVLQITHNSLNAASIQWCMGTECSSMNSLTSLTKRFTMGDSEGVQFDATGIGSEGYLEATLKVTIGLETHQVNIIFVNGDYDGIKKVQKFKSSIVEKGAIFDLLGRQVKRTSSGIRIVREGERIRKVLIK